MPTSNGGTENTARGRQEAVSGTFAPADNGAISTAEQGRQEAVNGTFAPAGNDAPGNESAALAALTLQRGRQEALAAPSSLCGDASALIAPVGRQEALAAPDLQAAPLAVVSATRELLERQYSEHLANCPTCREISRAYNRAVMAAVARQEAVNAVVREAPALHCCIAIGIDTALRGVEVELKRRAAAALPAPPAERRRGEPERPAGLVVELPDFTRYAAAYTITVTAGQGTTAETLNLSLARHESAPWWIWHSPLPRSRRRGKGKRLTYAMNFWAHREAAAALRVAGWSYEITSGWEPPASFQVEAMKADLREIR